MNEVLPYKVRYHASLPMHVKIADYGDAVVDYGQFAFVRRINEANGVQRYYVEFFGGILDGGEAWINSLDGWHKV